MLLTNFSLGQVRLLFHQHQGMVPLAVVWAILQEQAIKKITAWIPTGLWLKAILQLRSALLGVSSWQQNSRHTQKQPARYYPLKGRWHKAPAKALASACTICYRPEYLPRGLHSLHHQRTFYKDSSVPSHIEGSQRRAVSFSTDPIWL